jgi:multidrug efflux pump subunit AcrA (membrane-fusion protein)
VVVSIDPAATLIKGISTYKVTLQFNSEDDRIRSGMGANVTITDEKHANVLSVPKSSLLNDNGKTYVIVDEGAGKFVKTQITVGVVGIEGQAEVLSGLIEGQKVIYFNN